MRRRLAITLAVVATCTVPAVGQQSTPPDELRLADPAWTPDRTAEPVVILSSAEQLLEGLLSTGTPGHRAAVAALNEGGYVGGLARSYPSVDTRPALRLWAVRMRDVAAADSAVGPLRSALAAESPQTPAPAHPIPGVPGGEVLTRTQTGGPVQMIATFSAGAWVYGLEAHGSAASPPSVEEIASLAGRTWRRQPEPTGAGAAHPLVVTTALAAALGVARDAQRGRSASAAQPAAIDRIQAGRHGTTDWALAAFDTADEPVLFRRPVGGAWALIGDSGGPGCPRIPAQIRALWGLSTTCPAQTSVVARPGGTGLDSNASPFDGIGMWVWEVPASGGTAGIIRRARAHGLRTVFVKSGDGIHYWTQFDRSLAALKAAGLRVCGWQYARGRVPVPEARVAARAIQRGADCFVVNAEIEFTRGGIGRASVMHRRARAYMAELRSRAGHRVPIGFTSFAYVDLHARFPYSAFLTGPHAADVNMPQIYWGAFRQPVATAMRRAAQWNAIYGVPVAPIGGTYRNERPADLLRFRCLAAGYGWRGVSYWSFQHTGARHWNALGNATACPDPQPITRRYPELRPGTHGDPTTWLQERLRAWGYPVVADGGYGPATRAAVRTFQRDHGIQGSGSTTALTWALLLEPPPARP